MSWNDVEHDDYAEHPNDEIEKEDDLPDPSEVVPVMPEGNDDAAP